MPSLPDQGDIGCFLKIRLLSGELSHGNPDMPCLDDQGDIGCRLFNIEWPLSGNKVACIQSLQTLFGRSD
jgi:hypothetical protein